MRGEIADLVLWLTFARIWAERAQSCIGERGLADEIGSSALELTSAKLGLLPRPIDSAAGSTIGLSADRPITGEPERAAQDITLA